jgi:hypothetical protein
MLVSVTFLDLSKSFDCRPYFCDDSYNYLSSFQKTNEHVFSPFKNHCFKHMIEICSASFNYLLIAMLDCWSKLFNILVKPHFANIDDKNSFSFHPFNMQKPLQLLVCSPNDQSTFDEFK